MASETVPWCFLSPVQPGQRGLLTLPCAGWRECTCTLISHSQTIVGYQICSSCEIEACTLLPVRAGAPLLRSPQGGLTADRGGISCVTPHPPTPNSSHRGERRRYWAPDASCGVSCVVTAADTPADKCRLSPPHGSGAHPPCLHLPDSPGRPAV